MTSEDARRLLALVREMREAQRRWDVDARGENNVIRKATERRVDALLRRLEGA